MSDQLIGPDRLSTAPRKRLLVIAGPSGVGKATVTRELLRRNPLIHRARTFTTRSPRPGELEAGQYYFVSREEFEAKFATGEIMERTEVYGTGDLYGMPANLLTSAPPDKPFVLAEVDANGKDFLEERFPEQCVSIFITAPPHLLRQRIINRARAEGRAPQALAARLEKAREHIRRAATFDYLVINEEGRLEETVVQIEAIILAERLRVPPGLDLESAFFRDEGGDDGGG
jgi:guanylate kinase